MSTMFDQIVYKHRDILLGEIYWRASPIISHCSSSVGLKRVAELLKDEAVEINQNGKKIKEQLYLQSNSLKQIPKEQWRPQCLNLFDMALNYTLDKSLSRNLSDDLPKLVEAFYQPFKNPEVFANSSSINWSSWNSVTKFDRDMFIAVVDDKYFRFMLGLTGD